MKAIDLESVIRRSKIKITRIQDGFEQGAQVVIIDARNTNFGLREAEEIYDRAVGSYGGSLPGSVQIWTNSGVFRG